MRGDGENSLPVGWTTTGFNEIYELIYGKALPNRDRDSGGKVPVVGSSGIVGYHSESYALGPAIVVGRKGSAGAVIYIGSDFWPIDTTYFVKPPQGIDIKFAYYHFIALRLSQLEKSTAVPGLSRDDVYALRVTLPPANEQRRIVTKIEELFSELDKGVESLTTAREQLKAYRQSVLKHAFEGKLTEDWRAKNADKEWTKQPLGELIDFLTSGSRGWAEYYSNNGEIFIRAQNLKHDRLDLSDVAYVQLPEGKTEGVRTKVKLGDVLITITGANVTKTGFVDRELGAAYVSQHVALCRPSSHVWPQFLYWFLLAEAGGRKQLNDLAYGAGKPGLNLDNIRSVLVPLPSLDEQKAVVGLIKSKLEAADVMQAEIDAALARADALRQSILKRAFSGQLVPQDLADEPASVLLERIRAERQAGVSNRTRRKITHAS